MGDVALVVRVVVFAGSHCDPVAQAADLQDPQAKGQVRPDAEQYDHHERDVFAADRDADLDDIPGQEVGDLLDEIHGKRAP